MWSLQGGVSLPLANNSVPRNESAGWICKISQSDHSQPVQYSSKLRLSAFSRVDLHELFHQANIVYMLEGWLPFILTSILMFTPGHRTFPSFCCLLVSPAPVNQGRLFEVKYFQIRGIFGCLQLQSIHVILLRLKLHAGYQSKWVRGTSG
jgi:hypothetical protein